jgi:hypothetical protein
VSWYRLRATARRRWPGLLAVALLLGLTGGLALGSAAAARRTQSSFGTFLASTRPSDLQLSVQSPDLTARLGRLPQVTRVRSASGRCTRTVASPWTSRCWSPGQP